jgi:hypothetical protein
MVTRAAGSKTPPCPNGLHRGAARYPAKDPFKAGAKSLNGRRVARIPGIAAESHAVDVQHIKGIRQQHMLARRIDVADPELPPVEVPPISTRACRGRQSTRPVVPRRAPVRSSVTADGTAASSSSREWNSMASSSASRGMSAAIPAHIPGSTKSKSPPACSGLSGTRRMPCPDRTMSCCTAVLNHPAGRHGSGQGPCRS